MDRHGYQRHIAWTIRRSGLIVSKYSEHQLFHNWEGTNNTPQCIKSKYVMPLLFGTGLIFRGVASLNLTRIFRLPSYHFRFCTLRCAWFKAPYNGQYTHKWRRLSSLVGFVNKLSTMLLEKLVNEKQMPVYWQIF